MRYEPQRDVEQKVSIERYENVCASFHFHKTIELIYVIKGSLKIKAGAETKVIVQGEAVFIPAYFAHSVECEEKSESYTFMVSDAYYQEFLNTNVNLNYFFLGNKAVNRSIYKYLKEFEKLSKNCSRIVAQGFVNIILGTICANYEIAKNTSTYNNLVVDVIKYIDDNFQFDITLDTLSTNFGYSKSHFSKLFNHLFKCNLNFFVNSVRHSFVEQNKKSGKNLSDLIYQAGFKELSSYYRFSKKKKELETSK